jgi:hypothetical protein
MRLLFLFLLLPKKKRLIIIPMKFLVTTEVFETIHKEDKKTDREIHPTTIP